MSTSGIIHTAFGSEFCEEADIDMIPLYRPKAKAEAEYLLAMPGQMRTGDRNLYCW